MDLARRPGESDSEPRRLEEAAQAMEPGDQAFPVVGIGASAGGLQAFRKLLDHLPLDTGMAYVLIPHLSPTHESFISELLSRSSKIPIREVEPGMQVEPDHAYVIRPNTLITISRDRLLVAARDASPVQRNECINHFMMSLAREYGPKAIGVVLSGTASDGSTGIEAIQAGGGITFAQDDSADFKDMPRNAVATGAVDFVLPPEGIAAELGRISKHPSIKPSSPGPARDAGLEPEEEILGTIFRLLRTATGVDFGQYKRNTIRRRIARRMAVCKVSDLASYVRHLGDHPAEIRVLHDELLIHVTSFFREPEAFETLKAKVFPSLMSHRHSDDAIRVWVPGCSSGEEVYSIAIALLESLEAGGTRCELQLFGTDVSDRAIEQARAGIYESGVMSDVSPERRRRFFTRLEEGSWQISKAIRDLCVFARQDVIKDPPFSRLDLLSCRNMLIYLGLPLQKRVIPLFHYSLKPGGFLMLGSSESVEQYGALFSPVDKKTRIFSKVPGSKSAYDYFPQRASPKADPALESKPGATVPDEFDAGKAADRLLAQFLPAGIVINDKGQVVEFRGETGLYLRHPPGKPSTNVLKLVREELVVDLDAAVREARLKGARVRREGLRFKVEGRLREVRIEVLPIPAPAGARRYFLALFEETAPRIPAATSEPRRKRRRGKRIADDAERGRALAELSEKLDSSREYQQSIVEKFEATNEELRSASEETLSANEELQSTNEELETAKEELQSTNEELTTLNDELQRRTSDLSQLYGDLQNVIAGVNIPLAIVDVGLRLRRFTPQAEKLLGVIAGDVGRRITDFKPKVDLPDLEGLLRGVMDTLDPADREVRDAEGRWYSLRIRPYRTPDNRIDGAVVVFVDITDLKKSMAEIEEARTFLEAVLNTVRDPLLVLDRDLHVRMANRAFYESFGGRQEQSEDVEITKVGGGQWDIPALRGLLEEILRQSTRLKEIEVEHEFKGIGRRTLLLHARRIEFGSDGPQRILLAITDVTELRRAAAARLQLALVVESTQDAVITNTLDERITSWNRGAEQIFGYSAQEVIGRGLGIIVPSDRREEEGQLMGRIRHGERVATFDTKRRRKDRSMVDVAVTVSPHVDDHGTVVGASMIARDITGRKRVEEEIRALNESLERRVRERTSELEESLKHLDTFSYSVSHDLRAPLRAMSSYSQMLIEGYAGKVLDATGQDYARRVAEAARRMDALVQDLLEYSRIGRVDIAQGPVPLGDLITEVLKDLEGEFTKQAVQVVVDPELPCVRGHRKTLARVLTNLLSNAAKFVAPGTEPRIKVRCEMRDAWVRLWIEDNGIGIPPEHLERVFGVFERLHKQKAYAGTGIGLAIVRKSMERMGGRVGVESEVGKGSRFWIELPIEKGQATHERN